MVCASRAILAILFLALPQLGSSSRIKAQTRQIVQELAPELKLNNPDLIEEGAPLVPGLVSESPNLYKIKEKMALGNNYVVKRIESREKEKKLDEHNTLEFKGKFTSKYFGHGSIHVLDPSNNKEIFKVRRSRHNWNPVEWVGRFSYHILPPNSKNNEDAIFTVIKDYFGRGWLWQKEEWRIYKGMQREEKLAYYCVGSYMAWDIKCYNSVKEYNTGRNGYTVWGPPKVAELDKIEPVAQLSKKIDAATLIGGLGNLLPNALYLKTQAKADTALFLAFVAIIDTAHDITNKGSVISVMPSSPAVVPGGSALGIDVTVVKKAKDLVTGDEEETEKEKEEPALVQIGDDLEEEEREAVESGEGQGGNIQDLVDEVEAMKATMASEDTLSKEEAGCRWRAGHQANLRACINYARWNGYSHYCYYATGCTVGTGCTWMRTPTGYTCRFR